MKKTTFFIQTLLCLFLSASPHLSYAQSSSDLDLETQVANATSQLDLSGCGSGIFTDQLPQYVPLEYFDGSYLSDSTALNTATYKLMYGMLDKGHIGTSPMQSVDVVWDELSTYEKRDTIELSGLYYRYHQFKKTALEQNLVSWNGTHFQDISGANQSPYQENTVFAFTALRNHYDNTNVTFHFDSNRFYSNVNTSLSGYQINYDDGNGWQAPA